jgi:hypothetical protein
VFSNKDRILVILLVQDRFTSSHLRSRIIWRNCSSLRMTYTTPSISPESPIFADLVATIVNARRPPRGFGTLITLTSCRRFAPFVRTLETGTPRILRTTRTGRADGLTRFARDADAEEFPGRFGGICVVVTSQKKRIIPVYSSYSTIYYFSYRRIQKNTDTSEAT